MAKKKMIISFNEESMDFAVAEDFPSRSEREDAKKFRAYVRDRVIELYDLEKEEADALIRDGADEGVFYGEDDKGLHAAIMFPGGDGCEYLQLLDVPS